MVREDGRWGKSDGAARRGLIRSVSMDGRSGISELEWRLMGVMSQRALISGTAGELDIAVGRSAITMVRMLERGRGICGDRRGIAGAS